MCQKVNDREGVKRKEEAVEEEEEKKGVTIAKLGPFKMSVEPKGAGGGGGSGGKGEKADKDKEVTKGKVRSRGRSKPGEDKARRKSRVEEEKDEHLIKPLENEKISEKEKEVRKTEK